MPNFDWGDVYDPVPGPGTLFAAKEDGYRLFYIQSGEVRFPTSSFRVPYFRRPSAVGYINEGPIEFEIPIRNLVSGDEVTFELRHKFILSLKADQENLWAVVEKGDQLGKELELIAQRVSTKVCSQFAYSEIFFRKASVSSLLGAALGEQINDSLPYFLSSSWFSSRSEYPEVDNQLEESRARIAIHSGTKEVKKQEEEITKSQQEYELGKKYHENELKKVDTEGDIERAKMLRDAARENRENDRDANLAYFVKAYKELPEGVDGTQLLNPAIYKSKELARFGKMYNESPEINSSAAQNYVSTRHLAAQLLEKFLKYRKFHGNYDLVLCLKDLEWLASLQFDDLGEKSSSDPSDTDIS